LAGTKDKSNTITEEYRRKIDKYRENGGTGKKENVVLESKEEEKREEKLHLH
jgi:hypothetical protein